MRAFCECEWKIKLERVVLFGYQSSNLQTIHSSGDTDNYNSIQMYELLLSLMLRRDENKPEKYIRDW